MKDEVLNEIRYKLSHMSSTKREKDLIMEEFQNGILKYGIDQSGIYRDDDYSIQKRVNDNLCWFRVYTDIESGEFIEVSEEDLNDFLSTHIIISTDATFSQLRRDYIIGVVKENKEETVKKIVKKYSRE